MFDTILIANRGEIACRIARTARRLGMRTVGVYSDADANALHVAACDEARRLGPAPPRESYLDGAAIIAAAKAAGAQAVHPGYGFLSENEAFATAVVAAGLVFIGPPPAAIRAMGSKAEAKAIMGKAGVPIVPGYHGSEQDDALLLAQADAIGYPVLIKPSAGGGGKGMRGVERRDDFAAALAAARREAQAGFGDARVLLEKYLAQPRHIEIQVFADTHGQCVHLFERDCSVQRRHQKVLEEAPAPGMTAARRARMGAAAVAAAKAIGYTGAGTVEFIVADAAAPDAPFYFMEMNTRLQVEHPVTEMITGLDLVEWQLRVAAGERLPLAQQDIAFHGHALEARIYAEDPDRNFLPSIGRIAYLRSPQPSAFVRIDTGVREGDAISRYYDPLIAKLITWGEDRPTALRRLKAALAEYRVAGVTTNVAFLQRVIAHDAFAAGRVDTGLIARHQATLLPPPAAPSARVLAVAALGELARTRAAAAAAARIQGDPASPWHSIETWWLNSDEHAIVLTFEAAGATYPVRLRTAGQAVALQLGENAFAASVAAAGSGIRVQLDGIEFAAEVVAQGEERYVFCGGALHRLRLLDPLAHSGDEEPRAGHLMAPMSGAVVAVLVKPGEAVPKGAPLLVLEAMKMEHTITAPAAGTVSAVHFHQGEQVAEGAVLIDLDDGAQTQAT
ncbi:MAG TPA: biotin carboxylase N-terminal domain-containing protein [Casimicrobiaceae bacterium]|jgi:3-methylcrotonyl-CoA carboxylase alpha subunit|nr:biotin carboxylase N-terminal domain-containing protein [Casimicrobiaceae bacterium]